MIQNLFHLTILILLCTGRRSFLNAAQNCTITMYPSPGAVFVGGTQAQYYQSFRSLEVDGVLYFIYRWNDGMHLWGFDTVANSYTDYTSSGTGAPQWDDSTSSTWINVEQYSTIQLQYLSIISELWIIGFDSSQMYAYRFDIASAQFVGSHSYSGVHTTDFNAEKYYYTLRTTSDGSNLYISGRRSAGVDIWKLTSVGVGSKLTASAWPWSDAESWDESRYYKSFKNLIYVDGILYVPGRSALYYMFARFNISSASWLNNSQVAGWSDAGGWYFSYYLEAIHSILGWGGILVLGRGASGQIICRFTTTATMTCFTQLGEMCTDASNWYLTPYYPPFPRSIATFEDSRWMVFAPRATHGAIVQLCARTGGSASATCKNVDDWLPSQGCFRWTGFFSDADSGGNAEYRATYNVHTTADRRRLVLIIANTPTYGVQVLVYSGLGQLLVTSTTSATISKTISPPMTRTPTNVISQSMTTPSTASVSLSPSNTMSHAISPTPTVSLESTLSNSLPNSDSVTLAATSTFTPSHTPTASISRPHTDTISLVPTPSFTTSRSFSLTPTITPPSTPTKTFSSTKSITTTLPLTATASAVLTKTLSESTSQSLTNSPSITKTPLITTTTSLTLTQTNTNSETISAEVYCGGMDTPRCISLTPLCNISEEGGCFASNCSRYSDSSAICLGMGCVYQRGKGCEKPLECRDVFDSESCQLLLNCRWNEQDERCRVDKIPCRDQETQAQCMDVQCAWNSVADPRCFKPIVAPALCRLLNSAPVCLSQKCLWLEGLSVCESWEVTCEEMIPHPSSCELLPLCYFSAEEQKCHNINGTDFESSDETVILSASHPLQVFPGQKFDVNFVGSRLEKHNKVVVIVKGTTLCPSPLQVNQSNISFVTRSYDFELKRSLVEEVYTSAVGSFSFCIYVNKTHVLGPLSTFNATLVSPVITSCGTEPRSPFLEQHFTIDVLHDTTTSAVDPESLFAVIESAADVSFCPRNTSQYHHIKEVKGVSDNIAVAQYISSVPSNYSLCIMNRGLVPVLCPSNFSVDKLPPWYDPQVLNKVMKTLPKIDGLDMFAYNALHCKSMSQGNRSQGLAIHPRSMPLRFGDGIDAYAGFERCVFGIQPLQDETDTADDRGAVLLDVHYVSLATRHELRIFSTPTAGGTSFTSTCEKYSSSTTCRKAACRWSTETNECLVGASAIEGCPTQLGEAYTLSRAINFQAFSESGKITLPLTMNGAMLVVCAISESEGAIGVSVSYRTQETLCPNDCTDQTGTVNGNCQESADGTEYKCFCNIGYSGVDCSRRRVCRGTGIAADSISAASLDETFGITGDACGLNFEVTLPASMSSEIVKYGIGLSIRNVTSTTSRQDSESTPFSSTILIRSGSYNGKLVTKITPDDVDNEYPEQFRILLEDFHSLYVEFQGKEGDSFRLLFTAVSLVCPGKPGATGLPTTREEICHGKGKCVRTTFYDGIKNTNEGGSNDNGNGQAGEATTRALMDYAYFCECRVPFASSFIGGTCNTCGFGYQADSFPACLPATICGRNCTGHGLCYAGMGCFCEEGWYGLDCQLVDDGERMGSLKKNLKTRIPLNARDAGNALNSGTIDRTVIGCSLPGTRYLCIADKRKRGRVFKQQMSYTVEGSLLSRRHRNVGADLNNGTTPVDQMVLLNDTGEDSGLALNSFVPEGAPLTDFVRQDNITHTTKDLYGAMTIAGWVKLTGKSHGFFVAKVDAEFMADGRSPALEKALSDSEDRAMPLSQVQLRSERLNVYFGIVFFGGQKRVDLIVTNPTMKNSTSSSKKKEEWLYVRHFRLGSSGGDLFDDTWRYFAFRFSDRLRQEKAQIIVDATTQKNDPGYFQCLPFLPVVSPYLSREEEGVASAVDSRISMHMPGQSISWGYGLRGSLDELHAYNAELPEATISDIGGGSLFTELLRKKLDGTTAFLALGVIAIFISIAIAWWAWHQREKQEAGEEDRGGPEQENNPPLSPAKWIHRIPKEMREMDEIIEQHQSPIFSLDGKKERGFHSPLCVTSPLPADEQTIDKEDGTPTRRRRPTRCFEELSMEKEEEGKEEDGKRVVTPDGGKGMVEGDDDAKKSRGGVSIIATETMKFSPVSNSTNKPKEGTGGGAAHHPPSEPPKRWSFSTQLPKKLDGSIPFEKFTTAEDTTATTGIEKKASTSGWGRVRRLSSIKFEPDDSEHQHHPMDVDDMKSAVSASEDEISELDDGKEVEEKEYFAGRPRSQYQQPSCHVSWPLVEEASKENPEVSLSPMLKESSTKSEVSLDLERIHVLLHSQKTHMKTERGKELINVMEEVVYGGAASEASLMESSKSKESGEQEDVDDKASADEEAKTMHNASVVAKITTFLEGDGCHLDHLELLEQIAFLIVAKPQDQMQNAASSPTTTKQKRGNGAESASSRIVLPQACTAMLVSWQVIAQLATAVELPESWFNVWGDFTLFLGFDFLPSLGSNFTIVYVVLVVLAFLCALIMMIYRICLKSRRRSRITHDLHNEIEERKKAWENGEEEYEPEVPLSTKIITVVSLLLNFLYTPVTYQSLVIIFCHPMINCIFDCYADAVHRKLVVLAVFTILLISIGVPIFNIVLVRTAIFQYQRYVGNTEEKVLQSHWGHFVTVLPTPFSSLYDPLRWESTYFECIFLIFRTLITAILVMFPSESSGQLYTLVAAQIIFTLYVSAAQPYIVSLGNGIILWSQLFALAFFVLRCGQVLVPTSGSIGTLMVLLTSMNVFVQVMMIAAVLLVPLILKHMREKEEKKKQRNKTGEESSSVA